MSGQNTSTAKPAPLPLLSDTQESLIKDAFRTLLAAVGSYGSTVLPSDINECSVDQWELLAGRALKATRTLRKARRDAALAEVSAGIKAAIAPHIAAHAKKREAYTALLANTPEEMKGFIAPFPQAVSVPMSDIAPAFPEGTKPETMVVVCKDLDYTVGKGADGKHFVKVPTPFTSK